MASDGEFFGRMIRYTLEFWAWFFDVLRFLYDPGPQERLHLEGVTVRPDTIADTRRAMPFRAFIDRCRRHAEFLSGGFATDSYRAAI